MKTHTLTDYDIQALIDDELDHEESKKVLTYIQNSATAHKRYIELSKQKELLKLWWKDKRNN